MRAPRLLWVGLAVAFVALAACGDDEDSPVVSPTTAAGSSSTIPTTTPGGLEGAVTTPTSVAPTGDQAHLSAVRVAHQAGFDRLVFEFEEPAAPGYQVQYQPRPIVQDGSGNEVAVEGDAVLVVRLENASGADITGEGLRITYNGPSRIRPDGTTAVVEAVRIGDFEGVLTWAVGVRSEAPFKVSTLSGPARVVIDVQAPS